MSVLDDLRSATTLSDLAAVLGMPPSTLAYTLYKAPPAGRYTTFAIPKRSGGTRAISAPDARLKELQKALATALGACNDEIAARRRSPDSLSHGFERGRSILTNAWPHKKRRWVLNLDLTDFFPSINFGRVRGFLMKNRDFALHPKVATAIAQAACFQNSLPQGAPLSPVIANMVAHVLDVRLARLAAGAGCTYTRYADDLTFSTNLLEFPIELAREAPGGSGAWHLSDCLLNEIRRSGFAVNPSKTQMQRRPSQQLVTGLTVNEKVNVRAEYYRAARAMCDSLFKKGKYFRGAASSKTLPPGNPPKLEDGIPYLEGVMAHIYHVKHGSDLRSGRLDLKKEGEDAKKAKYAGYRDLYKKLLYYKHFVALDRPLIVCEGKTDNIYLRSALKALHPRYSRLASVDKGKIATKVTFLKHSRVEHDILELSGGSANLAKLVARYEKEVYRFPRRPLRHPVIVLIDNDSGSDPVFKAMKQHRVTATQATTLDFYFVSFNLYVVKTPEIGLKGSSAVEDLFDAATLAKPLDGKTFSREENYDPAKHYGKFEFADRVVRANLGSVDFSRFVPLLDRIVAVIDDYATRKP